MIVPVTAKLPVDVIAPQPSVPTPLTLPSNATAPLISTVVSDSMVNTPSPD